ncbi:MAG: methyl-accepting chemotaxis protein [Candidatus Pelethousia sp.]|nr:methyl-accepting chemotaxis protein [Candidatus Pelethousia sp.]
MKLSKKIPLFAILMIMISVVIIAGLSIVESYTYNKQVSYERVDSSINDLNKQIQLMLERSRRNAVSISQNYRIMNALANQNFDQMKAALDDLNQYLEADTISITDLEGNVMIRQHEPSKLGDNISNQTNVQEALEGKVLTTLEPGALVKLSCRTGAPVRNEKGDIIGTVVTGYTFENSNFLDELKALHNTELTIFANDIRIATTITQNGERAVGTSLNENIAKTVLEEGNTYTGKADILGVPHITEYVPLRNTEGEIVGVVFAGLSEAAANKATRDSILHMAAAAILIIAICAFILFRFMNKNIKQPMYKLTEVSTMLAQGHLDVEVESATSSKKDEVGLLNEAMYQMVRQLKAYISDITQVLSAMSNNDFTVKSSVSYIGDFTVIGTSLHGISSSLNETLLLINTATEQVSSGASQVSSGAQALATGSTEQAASVEQLNASISEVSKQTEENAAQVRRATAQLGEAGERLNEGGKQMSQLIEAMSDINSSSNQIANITKVIEDIAFQTNILALNAAIEAARAGNAGKGFAVVADEVRNLAAKSAEAAKQTASLIGASVETVEKGSEITTETAQIVQDAVRNLAAIIEDIGQVEQASNQQSLSIGQIRQGLEQVSTVVQSNAATAEENSAISEEMSAQAAMLRQEVAKFKLHHAELVSASEDSGGSPYPEKQPSAYALIAGKY